MSENIQPEETPTTAMVANIISEGDPDTMLAVLERKAELAVRMREAINQLIASQTFPSDWKEFGGKACLSSAGAERIARIFPIRVADVEFEKEDATDKIGPAYRYVYRGFATMYERTIYVEGNYSTRDKFLGFANGEWRAVEDINEGDIRSAAYHVFLGNAVKALLGIRNLPWDEFKRIMKGTGQDPGKSGSVKHGSGTQGGTSADDSETQGKLGAIIWEFVKARMAVSQKDDGEWELVPLGEAEDRPDKEIAGAICVALSGFDGDKGPVKGKEIRKLTGKWLGTTLGKARKLKETLDVQG